MQRLAERFWFLRGVVTALATIGLLSEFTALNAFESIVALFAVIAQWNSLAEHIGSFLGLFPLLPTFSAPEVNSFLIISGVIVPGLVASYPGQSYIAFQFWFVGFSYVLALYLFAFIRNIFDLQYGEIWIYATMAFGLLGFVLAAAERFRTYVFGMVFVGSFVLTIQVLYLLNTPVVEDFVRRSACSYSPSPAFECARNGQYY